jgi:nicotinamidase-related amidase
MTPSNTQTYLAKGTTASGFRADRTVVLIIDPVNDFLSEGGAAWDLTKSTVKKNDVVGSLRRVIDGAHERAVPVLFAPMAYTEEDYADEQLQRRTAINRIMFERRMFLAGSWGADFHPDLQPSDADIVLEPHKGTDVAETDLLEHLERLGTTHVVICGMTANLCCESTGRHLAEHGFDVTYLSDAIGAESLPAYEASIHLNYPLIGNAVLEVDELLVALDEGAQQQAPQAGDTVYGSDRGKIGTIDEIVPASADNAGHLLVKRGVILDRDIYIPIDAVTRRAGESVVINVPKLVVGKMPWDKPPSPADVTAKQGPAAAQVEHLYGSRSPSGAPAA